MPWDRDNQMRSSFLLGLWLSLVVAIICLFAQITPVSGRPKPPPAVRHIGLCVAPGSRTDKR